MRAGAPARMEAGDDGVLRVTLCRPRQRNPLDHEVFDLLAHAYGVRAHRPDVRCVLLRGEGPSFCSGLDRGLLAGLAGADAAAVEAEGTRLQGILDAVERCPRPTVVAVQGACIGGGLALLLACDLRVLGDDAWAVMMESRYAFLPDLGHLHRLQREVGPARARQAVLLGDRLDAATLLAWGVVNEVVPAAELAAAAERWAARCAALPPLLVEAAKPIMSADPGGADGAASQGAALRANAERLLRSADAGEGLAAALEGRPPRFSGR